MAMPTAEIKRIPDALLKTFDAVRQIHAQRSHRRPVPHAEAHCVHRVVEILYVALCLPQRDLAEAGVDVPHIVEEYAADIVADQRKAELVLIEEQECATQIQPRSRVARPRLQFREPAMRGTAAAEETLGQRDGGQRITRIVECVDVPDFRAARQHQFLADRVVSGIACQDAREVERNGIARRVLALRPEEVIRQSDIQCVVDPLMRVHRVVAAVLNPTKRDDAYAHGLR